MKKTLFLLAFLMTLVLGAKADSFFDTSSMSAKDQNAPIGWGAGVTGGADQNQVTVTTLSELQSALTGTDQKTIIVDGTIEFTGRVSIDGVQNKSIYGKPGAKLYNPTHSDTKDESGILTLKNCSNIIIRNLIFQGAGAYDIDGNDNLTLQNCSNIWVDHCDFQDGVDGNLDCNNGSDNICVSWCRFRYLIAPWSGGSGGSDDHRFTNLWGGDDTASGDDGKLNTTFVNCWWDEGCRERMPRVRFGKIHLLNCLYSSSVADYCVGGGYKSNVYIEKCAFTGSGEPWRNFATKDGYTDYNYTITGCTGAADDQGRSGGIDYFTPTDDYTYTSYASNSVESVVSNASNGAGATLQLPAAEPTTVYSWEGGNQVGGTIEAQNAADPSDTNLTSDINSSYIRLRGAKDYTTAQIVVTFNKPLHAGDLINVTAYRNKNATGKTSGFKAKFENGGEVASSTGTEFVNTNSAVEGSGEYSATPNTCTFTVPAAADGSTTMTVTRSHTSTNLFISKLEITSTASDEPTYTTVYDIASSLNASGAIYEGNSGTIAATTADPAANAPELQVDATSGKLGKNNASWAQINAGAVLTLPGVPEGATITFALYATTALTIKGVAYTNGQTYTATKDEDVSMTCTTNGYIQSITVEGTAFVTTPEPEGYTNTWQFGKSNGAETFALQKSPEYVYTVNEHSLTINTDAGKLNNSTRDDQWAQCNNGTLFKVPTYEGAKLTWGKYSGGSETGFTIGGQLYNDYYIATAEGTTEMTATGISYLSHITVQPVTMYEITGTITGGDVNSKSIIFTANGNGQQYSATVAENAFTLKVPADTYTLSLDGDVAYVVSTPTEVTVSEAGSIGEITIVAATPQTVTGAIANAPAEAFTLTFTGISNNKVLEMAAGATSYTTTLAPDTYTISTNVGTLSALSVESFQVVKDAVTHNIYFPEAAVPAATQAAITVDNTAAVSANHYKTVTDALAAAKAGKISNPVITLTSGQTYREQVIVDQADVTLKTSGAGKAKITFYYGIGYTYYSLGANGLYDKDRANTRNSIKMIDPVRWGTTVLVKSTANNFKAENIIFENSFNQYYTDEEVVDGVRPNGLQSITYDRTLTSGEGGYKAADAKAVTERAAAIAIENGPSGVELYNCEFVGSQDTFYSSGKIYVKNCNIIGNTDYIFGGGYVVFDDCDLTIGGYSDQNATAYITAYKDGNEWNSAKKYVFRDCTVKTLATPRAYYAANLGRDWGGEAASVYYFNLKNEIGNKLSYSWSNMGGGVSAGTADLHVYDFDPAINSNYATTGTSGANINGLVSDENALTLYKEVVTRLGYMPAHLCDIQLDETNNHNAIKIAATSAYGLPGDVTLKRSITEGKWSTIVLPFAVSADKLITAFGPDYKLAELTTGDENTLNFTTRTAIEACKPYAIKVSVPFTSATFEDVYIDSTTPEQTVGNWVFNGTYTSQTAPVDSYVFSGNKLRKVTANNVTVKPFRAYITYNGVAPANELEFILDGETTGLSEELRVESGEFATATYYDLQGRKVAQPTKGVYIVNGRKTIVK